MSFICCANVSAHLLQSFAYRMAGSMSLNVSLNMSLTGVHFAIRCVPWYCLSDEMNYFERDDNGYNAFYAVLQCNFANPFKYMYILTSMGVNAWDVDGNGNNACQVYYNMEFGADYCVRNTTERERMTHSFKVLGLDIWVPVRDGQTPEQLICSERDYDVQYAREANNIFNSETPMKIISLTLSCLPVSKVC